MWHLFTTDMSNSCYIFMNLVLSKVLALRRLQWPLPSVIAEQQVLKLLINYTHRWAALLPPLVMDTAVCNKHVCTQQTIPSRSRTNASITIKLPQHALSVCGSVFSRACVASLCSFCVRFVACGVALFFRHEACVYFDFFVVSFVLL